MENNTFHYSYSAKKNKEVEGIRRKYMPKEVTDIDTLRELDKRTRRPADIFAYVFGSISAVIMGFGMSLVMTDIAEKIGLGADPMLFGVLIGGIGMLMALVNYPLYQIVMSARKKKYGAEILTLSDKIMNR